jgi:hypothetical protein
MHTATYTTTIGHDADRQSLYGSQNLATRHQQSRSSRRKILEALHEHHEDVIALHPYHDCLRTTGAYLA